MAFLGAVYIGQQPVSWLHLETDTKLMAICGASALWGIYTAAQPVVESIFADSVPTGDPAQVAAQLSADVRWLDWLPYHHDIAACHDSLKGQCLTSNWLAASQLTSTCNAA